MATAPLAIASYLIDALLIAALVVAVARQQADARRRAESVQLQRVPVEAKPRRARDR